MSANAGSRNSSNQWLRKLGVALYLLGKELRRLKLKRIDLRRADLRLGEKAYSSGAIEGQAELVSRLDGLTKRVTQLGQQERKAGSTFGEKAKKFASKVATAVQIGVLQLKRRRILRRLGANLRQSAANSSLLEETKTARAVADRLSSVETRIRELAPQTYPWARRPLLLMCLLLLLGTIAAFAIRHQSAARLAQQKAPAGRSSLSDEQTNNVVAQEQTFEEQMLQMQSELARRGQEQMQAQIAAAERVQREEIERRRAEQERVRREQAQRERVAAAERARQEEKQREEESRIAAEKARQEQQAREADAQRENEQQKAAAIAEHATKQNAGEQLVKVKTAAEAGDREAMFNLGNRYMEGDGVGKDPAEGVRWLRKAAEAGQTGAMFNLGLLYVNGEGVAKDPAEAVRWYKKAADLGDTDAMVSLGIAYHQGEGVEKDLNEAFRWVRKAAEAGNSRAMSLVGVSYANGEGVTKDVAEGVRWYRKAANAGDSNGMLNLGYAYFNGEGVAKDPSEGVRWYEKAAEKGNAAAMLILGIDYARGDGVQKDVAEALRWYRKAADAGNAKAMFKVGVSYRKGEGVAQDLAEAERWYRKAADAGNKDAIEALQALANVKRDWDNMLVLPDGRHVVVGENGEYIAYKSLTDVINDAVKNAERQQKREPGSTSASAISPQPNASTPKKAAQAFDEALQRNDMKLASSLAFGDEKELSATKAQHDFMQAFARLQLGRAKKFGNNQAISVVDSDWTKADEHIEGDKATVSHGTMIFKTQRVGQTWKVDLRGLDSGSSPEAVTTRQRLVKDIDEIEAKLERGDYKSDKEIQEALEAKVAAATGSGLASSPAMAQSGNTSVQSLRPRSEDSLAVERYLRSRLVGGMTERQILELSDLIADKINKAGFSTKERGYLFRGTGDQREFNMLALDGLQRGERSPAFTKAAAKQLNRELDEIFPARAVFKRPIWPWKALPPIEEPIHQGHPTPGSLVSEHLETFDGAIHALAEHAINAERGYSGKSPKGYAEQVKNLQAGDVLCCKYEGDDGDSWSHPYYFWYKQAPSGLDELLKTLPDDHPIRLIGPPRSEAPANLELAMEANPKTAGAVQERLAAKKSNLERGMADTLIEAMDPQFAKIFRPLLHAAADADHARLADSERIVKESGGVLCPKCGGYKLITRHDYNSATNPYSWGNPMYRIYENDRDIRSIVKCDECGGTGVVH